MRTFWLACDPALSLEVLPVLKAHGRAAKQVSLLRQGVQGLLALHSGCSQRASRCCGVLVLGTQRAGKTRRQSGISTASSCRGCHARASPRALFGARFFAQSLDSVGCACFRRATTGPHCHQWPLRLKYLSVMERSRCSGADRARVGLSQFGRFFFCFCILSTIFVDFWSRWCRGRFLGCLRPLGAFCLRCLHHMKLPHQSRWKCVLLRPVQATPTSLKLASRAAPLRHPAFVAVVVSAAPSWSASKPAQHLAALGWMSIAP